MDRLTTPLRFDRHALEKVWGGRALETNFGFDLPAGKPIGETWEIVDRAGENSRVAKGPLCGGFAGQSLGELMSRYGKDLLGTGSANRDGRFPVLLKYIDAAQDLSVQVHPDEASAVKIGAGAEAKTEAWYIVDVAPGGKLYAGLKPGISAEEYASCADSAAGVDALLSWDVQAGDCLLVPGGTVHAIGAGVTILEVQQNSDSTYRLYDWGRLGLNGQPRETHVAQGLLCTRFGEDFAGPLRPDPSSGSGDLGLLPLATSDFFSMDLLVPRAGLTGPGARFETEGCWQALAVIGGEGILVAPDGAEAPLGRGDVWLVPAAAGHVHIRRRDDAGELRLIRATA
ncbi:MAG: mannose-6-phosphate isomerase [Planctomycetota bacterium]|jgi:mannose-6-phosphate isomerase